MKTDLLPVRVLALFTLLPALCLGITPARAANVTLGVVADPCVGVPIEPTAAHKATGDWYEAWMHEWLALDWGQRCRYQGENRALPAATADRVVFIGDSITEGWKPALPQVFNAQRLDRGIGGQTTEQMIVRFRQDVIDLHPAVVHIMAGTNDVAGNRGPTTEAQIESNLATMAEAAKAAHIRVVLASIPPAAGFGWSPQLHGVAATIRRVNAWIKTYAERERHTYVDYHSVLSDEAGGLPTRYSEDGVHPNVAGYEAMQPLTDAAIRKALAAPKAH
jgi:lysophospholipase L1-like esterase